MTPEVLSFIYTLIIIFSSLVLLLAAVALVYAIGILHNLFKISRFVKEGSNVLRRDIFGFLERVFTDKNIKIALASFWAWSSGALKNLKSDKKTKRTRKSTTRSKSKKTE